MVITVEIYKEIRKLRLEGLSQRKIADKLGISRNTVKKYWDGAQVPWERKPYSRTANVMTEDITDFIQKCLHEDEQCRSKKQYHTARRIYERLTLECGFTGSESSVRRMVKELREKLPEAYVPLAFPAGDAMQIDWGEATVYLKGEKTVVNLFCARLCYSDTPFVRAYRRQNEESFLEANVRAMEYFGGVPRHVIFDNAKVAVKDGFGAHAKKQAGYSALSAHYGFDAVFCNPASGNEKGLVEGLVGYIRRNTCVPLPRINSMDELNRLLEERCRRYLSHQIRGKPKTVGEMFEEEQSELYPLPVYPYDPRRRTYVRVDRFCTVRFDTNNYSVPCTYCGKEVSVCASSEKVYIYFSGECIAEHERCLEKHQSICTLSHYLPLLEKKGRAIFYAKPVRDNLPSSFLDWLEVQKLPPKELVQILYRCCEEDCMTVMQESIHHTVPEPIDDPVTVQAVDLQAYDTFLSRKGGHAV